MTRLHINALTAIVLMACIAGALIYRGDACAAAGIAGSIGLVALTFAKAGNGD